LKKQKIKIAHLLNVLAPAGKESALLKIASKYDRNLFDVDIIILRNILHGDIIEYSNVNVIPLNSKAKNSIIEIPRLIKLFKKGKYDIVYTHSWNTLLEGYIAAKLSGIPIKIHGEHGTFEESFIKNKLQKYLWGKFDSVTVVAGVLKTIMENNFNFQNGNVTIVYNGINKKNYYPSKSLKDEVRDEFGIKDSFVVGTVGRYHPVKDHITLFKAIKNIKPKIPNIKLMLVGGEQVGTNVTKTYQREIEKMDIKDEVVFVPFTSTVVKSLNSFDIFVLSSISEGCSNVILEAMACGLPVIASNTGGNPELVVENESGLLFKVGDDKALGDKILRLYFEKELRSKFGENNLKRIHDLFTLEKTVKNYQDLFLKLADEAEIS